MSNQLMEARLTPALEKNLSAIKTFMQAFDVKEMKQLTVLAFSNPEKNGSVKLVREPVLSFYSKMSELGKILDAVIAESE